MTRILFHGNKKDKGGATLFALVLIFILSLLLLSVLPLVSARNRAAHLYKAAVIDTIEKENLEAADLYDFD